MDFFFFLHIVVAAAAAGPSQNTEATPCLPAFFLNSVVARV